MIERYWILLGMMGSGKSTVGRELARRHDRPFEDTDEILRQRFGRSIGGVFSVYGEEAFRDHETSILKSLTPKGAVLATGGGIVLRAANWAEMSRLGTSIFMDVQPEKLKVRLLKSRRRRPLLESEDWESTFDQIYSERIDIYRKADIRICLDDEDLDVTVELLGKALEQVR